MTCERTFSQRQAVGRFLSDLLVPVNCVRSSWNLVRSTTSVVGIIDLVHGLVVAILENSHLAFVVIKVAEAMFVGVLLGMVARHPVGQILGNSIEMLLLQSAVATGAMPTAASRMI